MYTAGWLRETPLRPAIQDYKGVSKKTKSSVSERETNNTEKDFEALCKSPATSSDHEHDHGSIGSPLLVEEVASSPVHM